jgi:hypothetical protein
MCSVVLCCLFLYVALFLLLATLLWTRHVIKQELNGIEFSYCFFSDPVIFNPKFRMLLNSVTWEKVFLEMIGVIQLAKKLPAFYEIRG